MCTSLRGQNGHSSKCFELTLVNKPFLLSPIMFTENMRMSWELSLVTGKGLDYTCTTCVWRYGCGFLSLLISPPCLFACCLWMNPTNDLLIRGLKNKVKKRREGGLCNAQETASRAVWELSLLFLWFFFFFPQQMLEPQFLCWSSLEVHLSCFCVC